MIVYVLEQSEPGLFLHYRPIGVYRVLESAKEAVSDMSWEKAGKWTEITDGRQYRVTSYEVLG